MAIINSTIYGSGGGQPSGKLYKIATIYPREWTTYSGYKRTPTNPPTFTKGDDEVVYRLSLMSSGYSGGFYEVTYSINGNTIVPSLTNTWWGSANKWRLILYNTKTSKFRYIDGSGVNIQDTSGVTNYEAFITRDCVGDVPNGIILPPPECILKVSSHNVNNSITTKLQLTTVTQPTSPIDIYALANYEFEQNTFTMMDGTEDGNHTSSIGTEWQNNTNLKYVDAHLVTSVGNSPFSRCTNLKMIRIPNSTSSLNTMGYTSNLNLKYFCCGSGSVGNDSFHASGSLEVFEKNGTGSFGNDVFVAQSHLNTLILRNTSSIVTRGANTFNSTPFATAGSGAKIYVPQSLLSTYQSNSGWSQQQEFFVKLEGSPYEDPNWYKSLYI